MNTNIHNIIHNELINNGWKKTTTTERLYKYKQYNSNAFDEFIIEYTSNDEVVITVPIPFRDSSMYYRNIFPAKNVSVIHEYIKMHLSNNL